MPLSGFDPNSAPPTEDPFGNPTGNSMTLPMVTVTPNPQQPAPAWKTEGVPSGDETQDTFSTPLISSAQAQEPTGREGDLMNLFAATYSNESNTGQKVHPSSAGALGPMQIEPTTFDSYKKPGETIDDWKNNIDVSQRIITDLYDRYGGDKDKVLIGYNAGEKRLAAYINAGEDPSILPPETQAYLDRAHRIWTGSSQRAAAQASTQPVDLASLVANWGNSDQLPVGVTTHASTAQVDLDTMVKDWSQEQRLTTDYPQPPSQGNAFVHAMSYWPGFFARVVAAQIGLPSDVMGAAANYIVKHPEIVAPMEGAGGMVAPTTAANPQELQQAQGLAQKVNSALPTTQNLRTVYGNVPASATAMPSELGDKTYGSDVNEMFAYPAIAMMTLGAPGAAKAAAGMAGFLSTTALNAAKGAYIFGVGDELGRSVTGGDKGSLKQQSATAAWSVGLEALRVAASVLMHKGVSGATAGAKMVTGKITPEQAMIEAQTQTTPQNLSNIANQPPTVPGFTTPAATASGDQGLQTLLFAATRGDRLAQARFNALFEQNGDAIEKAFNLPIGHQQDAVTFFQHQLDSDRIAMQKGLQSALDEAQRSFDAARGDSKIGLNTQAGAVMRGQVLGAAVRAGDDLLSDYADYRWMQAKNAGVMTVPVTNMESDIGPALLKIAQNAVRLGQGGHFPWDALSPFFKQASQDALFDADGNIKAAIPKASKILDQNGNPIRQAPPGGLPAFRKEQFTIQDIHSAASDIKAQARGERKAVTSPNLQGDPITLRYYSAIGQELNAGIDRNLSNMPLNLNEVYRTATGATANYYKLMHRGPIGNLLGRDLEGGSPVDPMQTFDKLTPDGLPGVVATTQLFSVASELQRIETEALNGGLGPSPIQQAVQAHPADRIVQAFGDALRQDFTTALYQQGTKGASNWLNNHSVMLEQYPELKAQFTGAVASGQSLEGLAKTGMKQFEEARANSIASNFLGGDGAGSLDMVTKSRIPGQQMNNLLDATGKDTTGAASRSIGQLMMARLQAEGATTGGYDPRKTINFFQRMEPAFQALNDRGILDINRVRSVVNSIVQMNRMIQNPGIVAADTNLNNFSLRALARRGFQIGGARAIGELGKGFGVGGIEAARIGSVTGAQAFDQFFDKIFQRLAPGQARNLAVDALFDPNLYRQITQPVGQTLAEKAGNLHLALEAWAGPSIIGQRATLQSSQTEDTSKVGGSQFLPKEPK